MAFLSPLNQRRLLSFQKNTRARWSLRIFLAVFSVSLFAEFIANDKPLLVYYDKQLYVPVLAIYPETTFGGDFDTETDYLD